MVYPFSVIKSIGTGHPGLGFQSYCVLDIRGGVQVLVVFKQNAVKGHVDGHYRRGFLSGAGLCMDSVSHGIDQDQGNYRR